MALKENITGIILAGGKSSRMGSDKAMLTFNGKRMIEFGISSLEEICNRVIIGANNSDYSVFNLPLVPDNYTGIGPVAGLEACLHYSKTRINLVTPSDTPNVNKSLYLELLEYAGQYDAIVPMLPDGKIEPLIGCYSRDILHVIQSQISANDYKIQNLLKVLNTKYLITTNPQQIKNINTPNDL